MKKKIWFRAKDYGWGWTPVTWQGWLVVGAFIVLLIVSANVIIFSPILYFLITMTGASAVALVSYKYGEKPEWRWKGKRVEFKRFKKK